MSEAAPNRRELLEARLRLQRQIEVLEAGPSSLGSAGSFIDNSGLIAELRTVLGGIDEALAQAGPGE
jgi:hypothetical protein